MKQRPANQFATKYMSAAKPALIAEIHELAKECGEPNWDGHGASAVFRAAVLLSEDFVLALPDWIPLPELSPEPDGSISLDWIQSRTCQFSVSVGTTG